MQRKAATWVMAYGVFLIVIGITGFASNPEKAKTDDASDLFSRRGLDWIGIMPMIPCSNRVPLVVAILAVVATFSSCAPVHEFNTKRYDRHNEAGEAWLSDQMDAPEMDVSGEYKSREWGRTLFVQTGRDVRGHLGDYPVKGVVSGRKAHLLVSESGWYYYSVILEMPKPGLLTGTYSRSIPYRLEARRDILLVATP